MTESKVLSIPLTEEIQQVPFTQKTESLGIIWYEILPEVFIEAILPFWDELNLTEVDTRLLFLPCTFIFQISKTEIIYFSMFDSEDKFLRADLTHTRIYDYLEYTPVVGEFEEFVARALEEEPEEDLNPNPELYAHLPRYHLPLPSILQPKVELPFEDIGQINYHASDGVLVEIDNHPQNSKELQLDELVLIMIPQNLLKWFKQMYLEPEDIEINGHCVYLCVDATVDYWQPIHEEFGEYYYTLCCNLRDHPREEVEPFLTELMQMKRIFFEYEYEPGISDHATYSCDEV